MLKTCYRFGLPMLIAAWGALALQAQTPPAAPMLLPLAGVHYRYWSEQIVQWIGPELPYSMIVLEVDARSKQPVYDAELMPRDGSKPVRYTNTAEQLAADQRSGFTVYQVPMQLDGPQQPEKGAQYLLRFNTEKGVPVVWQFVEGTDESDQGSGLSPVDAKIPVLLYREQGALAGEGTAIQIGGVTSTAEVWKEFAQPPYFIPYHGAISTGVHILSFIPGETAWKQSGSQLTDAASDTMAIADMAETNTTIATEIGYTEANGSVSRVSFGPAGAKRDHTLSLVFMPALAPGAAARFDVIAGKKTKIATGNVQMTAAPGGASERWAMDSPDTLKGKTAEASVTVQP
jgi:hypothetical protein